MESIATILSAKKWYTSWTLWFNVAILLIGFIQQLAAYVPIPAEILAYVATIGNFLLRFKTNKPLTK